MSSKFIIAVLVYFIFSCTSLTKINDSAAISNQDRKPSSVLCKNLFPEVEIKLPLVTDLITAENLKVYNFKIIGNNELWDTKTNNRLGILSVEHPENLYQWAPLAEQKIQYENGGILAHEMDYILKSSPQTFGRGYYVSKHPLDSSQFGLGLTVFKTDGPMVVLDRENMKYYDETSSLAIRLSKAGIDAYYCNGTWRSVLNTKHLKTLTPVDIIKDPVLNKENLDRIALKNNDRYENLETIFQILQLHLSEFYTKVSQKEVLNISKKTIIDALDNIRIDDSGTEYFNLNSRLKVDELLQHLNLKNKYAKMLEYVGLETAAKIIEGKKLVEGRDLDSLFKFSQKMDVQNSKVDLNKIHSIYTFKMQLDVLLNSRTKFRNYDVVMAPEEKSRSQKITVEDKILNQLKKNPLLTLTDIVKIDENRNQVLVSYTELPTLINLVKKLPVDESIKKYVGTYEAQLLKNPESRNSIKTYERILKSVIELFFSKDGRNALLKNASPHQTKISGLNPKQKALALYQIFMSLHPFEDGNGRGGRLMYEYLTLEMTGTSKKLILFDYNDDLFFNVLKLEYLAKYSGFSSLIIDFLDPQNEEEFKKSTDMLLKEYRNLKNKTQEWL